MPTEKVFRAARLQHRNALICEVFYQLTNHENYTFMGAYVFLENIFGIDERQIRKILRQNVKVELSSDNLSKLAVILHRISTGESPDTTNKASACHNF